MRSTRWSNSLKVWSGFSTVPHCVCTAVPVSPSELSCVVCTNLRGQGCKPAYAAPRRSSCRAAAGLAKAKACHRCHVELHDAMLTRAVGHHPSHEVITLASGARHATCTVSASTPLVVQGRL